MQEAHALEVTADNFQLEVLQQSMQVPVLLDFWAEWCGPCRTLGPVLDKLAAEYGGAFVLGKVNTEVEQELAAAFQVRSIPLVVLMDQGRPVDAFTGALPEAEIRKFLKRAGVEPTRTLDKSAGVDPNSPAGRIARARAAVTRGDVAGVRQALTDFPAEDELAAVADRLRDGLPWLEQTVPAEGAAATALARARAQFLAGRTQDALESLLESVAVDRAYGEGIARRAMLLCFAVLGEDHDVSDEYRRRLTTLLY